MSNDVATIPAGPPTATNASSFVGHAKLIGFITLISRVLGMAREAIAANYFGAGAIWSAFTVAFTIPNLFRKLFGEGALSAAFIPLYAQALRRQHAEADGPSIESHDPSALISTQHSALSANHFAAASVNLLVAILLGLTILGELLLVALLFVPMRWDYLLAIQLTAIMLPYVMLICGTAFLGAILQVHHRFTAITATSIVSNLCLIIAIIIAAQFHDLGSQAGQRAGVRWLSYSVLIAGLIQVVMLLPSLRAVGFRFRAIFDFWSPAIRRMLRLTLPVALGAGVLQISVVLDKGISFLLAEAPGRDSFSLFGYVIAYPMAEGAAARLNWAQFMYQFPLGVFAIALATAIFPRLSSDALDEGRQQFKSVLRKGVEAALFIGLPASVGMIVVRYPAVRLLFERGQFTYDDTRWVALSTAIYSSAIWAFSLQQILNRAYYALHDMTTPLIWGVANLLLNLVIELPLLWTPLREAAMPVGTLVSFAIQSIAMLWLLDRRLGGIGLRASFGPIAKMIVASGVMWIACIAVQHLPIYPHGESKMIWGLQLLILMATGGIVYFGLCAAMGLGITAHVLPRRSSTR